MIISKKHQFWFYLGETFSVPAYYPGLSRTINCMACLLPTCDSSYFSSPFLQKPETVDRRLKAQLVFPILVRNNIPSNIKPYNNDCCKMQSHSNSKQGRSKMCNFSMIVSKLVRKADIPTLRVQWYIASHISCSFPANHLSLRAPWTAKFQQGEDYCLILFPNHLFSCT